MRERMKISRSIAGAVVVMALTQCASVQEVEVQAPSGGNFEIFATPVDTRTANDGLSTLWVTGDAFSLFHATSGTTAYVSDGAFSVDDPDTGHARGTVTALSGDASDWYLVYPHAAGAASPASVPVTVGAPSGTAQVQAAADDMSHLAGEAFPLIGRALSVGRDETPRLAVSPAVAVVAVNVTNPGEGDALVSSVRFTASEPVVGTFTVDATGAEPVFKAVSASAEAVLELDVSALLKKGENAVFYLGIKPFVAKAGATLTLQVNDQVRTVTLAKDSAFPAGKIKTLNMTLDPSAPSEEGTYYFKKVDTFSPGKTYIFVAEDTDEDGEVHRLMASAIPEGTKNAPLTAREVTVEDGIITLSSRQDAFTFYESEYGTLIRQADGRYLYNRNSVSVSDLYADTDIKTGSYWTITMDSWKRAVITNRLFQIKYNPDVAAFQVRKTDDSGIYPFLYELQNSEDAVDAFLENTVPGVYSYEGADWLYQEGTGQISVRTGAETIAFRIFEPATYTVLQVTGIPVGVAEGDRLSVRLARYVKQAVTHSSTLSAKVVHLEDGKAWLMAGNGTGFIVCIQ